MERGECRDRVSFACEEYWTSTDGDYSDSVFYPVLIGPTSETGNVSLVADYIEHITSIIGRNCVGFASDFDGM